MHEAQPLPSASPPQDGSGPFSLDDDLLTDAELDAIDDLAGEAPPPRPVFSIPSKVEGVGVVVPPLDEEVSFPSLVVTPPSPPRRRLGEHAQAFAAYADAIADEKLWKPGETTLEFAFYGGPPTKCRGGSDPGFEVFEYENTTPPSGSEVVAKFEAMGGGIFRIRFLQIKREATVPVKTIVWEVEQQAATASPSRTRETVALLTTKANVDLQRYKIDVEERKHLREVEATMNAQLVRNLEMQVANAQREVARLRDQGSNTREQDVLVQLLREQLQAAQDAAKQAREVERTGETAAMSMFREIQELQAKMRLEEMNRYQEQNNQLLSMVAQVSQTPPPPPPPPPQDDSEKMAMFQAMMQQANQAAQQSSAQFMAAMQAMSQQQAMMMQAQSKAASDNQAMLMTLLTTVMAKGNTPPPAPPPVDPTLLTIFTAQAQAAQARADQMQQSLLTVLQDRSPAGKPHDAVSELVKTVKAVSEIQGVFGQGSAAEAPPPEPPPPATNWLDNIGKVLQMANIGNLTNAVATRIQTPGAASPSAPASASSPLRPPRALPPAAVAPPPPPAAYPPPPPSLPPAPPRAAPPQATQPPPPPPLPPQAQTSPLPPAPPPQVQVTPQPPQAPPPPAWAANPPPPQSLDEGNKTVIEQLLSEIDGAISQKTTPESFVSALRQNPTYAPFQSILSLMPQDTALAYLRQNAPPTSPVKSLKGYSWLKRAVGLLYGTPDA